MQQTWHLLDFWARSYDQFGGICTCCLVAEQELQKTPQMLHQDDLSHAIISARFHTYQEGMFLVHTTMYSTIWKTDDWRFFWIASWYLLHHSMWVYRGILIHPFCCILFLRLYMWPLHWLWIGAPGQLIPDCVGWFFESVVGRIIDSGCRLKKVVGFEFYSSSCTSYPDYL
jgi:hypothetical protein